MYDGQTVAIGNDGDSVLPTVMVKATQATAAPPVHELGSIVGGLVDKKAKPPAQDLVSVALELTKFVKPVGAADIAVAVNMPARVTTPLLLQGTATAGPFGFELVPLERASAICNGLELTPRSTIAANTTESCALPVAHEVTVVSELVKTRYAASKPRLPLAPLSISVYAVPAEDTN